MLNSKSSQSSACTHIDQTSRKRYVPESLVAVFWDRKGMLMVGFMQQGTTITSDVYCETLRKLRRDLQTSQIRCSARPHTAAHTQTLLEHSNWELFDHPPYNPDVAPSDYRLFTRTYLKNWLRSQRFNDNEELMEGVKTWLSSQAANFFDKGIQNLIPRYKCLNSGRNYVQK
jgi:hypothetical protein